MSKELLKELWKQHKHKEQKLNLTKGVEPTREQLTGTKNVTPKQVQDQLKRRLK